MFGKNKTLYLVVFIAVGCCAFFCHNLSKQMKSVVHYTKRSYRFLSSPHDTPDFMQERNSVPQKRKNSLCHRLKTIPYGEDAGLVKSVKKVELLDIKTPYNASIIEDKNGYLLFFRYDVKDPESATDHHPSFKSYIGVAPLDQKFDPLANSKTIDTKSPFSEDPRVISFEGDLFISYNDLADNTVYSRTIHLARLEKESFAVKYILDLDQHIQPIEKNWVPFIYRSEGKEKICFGYSINPHKILKMEDSKNAYLDHPIYPNEVCLQNMPWFRAWGPLRGGTPARLVDGEYLAFFHSSFKESSIVWYVMGAYTFEAKPPFRVTAISANPILFKGIYDTPSENTSHSQLRCIFPSGFAIGKQDGQDVIHVSCGENDCAVKIVTLDKAKLLQSLTPIPLATKEPSFICDQKK